MKKILVVEDEHDIRALLQDVFAGEYKLRFAKDGKIALNLIETERYDLVILDLMLPLVDGLTVLQNIRQKFTTPVLILSAKNREYERVTGLEGGADDYLTKPFSLLELQARVKALLRRNDDYQQMVTEQIASIGDLTVDYANKQVTKKGKIIFLTAIEIELLYLLLANPNTIFTKIQLYTQIWDDQFLHDDNLINAHIRRLRKKIEDDPSNPSYIKTVWGIGYRIGGE